MNLRNTISKHALLFFLLIPIVSIVLHWRIFSTDLIGVHLWRQSQTAINIQNFYRHDFNIMNPRTNSLNGDGNNIKRFEFPIMQWLVAAAHKVFGESIVVTRISMFLIGIWGVLGVYFLLKWLWDDKIVALLGAWAFNFSPIFYFYTMNPLPDLFALCSTIWAMAFFFRYIKTAQKSAILLSASLLGMATLAKLPFVIFGSMVGIYVLQQWFKNGFKALKETIFLSFFYIFLLLPAFFWYKWVIPTWGDNGVLMGIFSNQVPLSITLEIFQFHAFEFLPKLLLNYAAVPFFFVSAFFTFKNKTFSRRNWAILAATGLSVIVYFLFEYNMIGLIHTYYMLPFLPPLCIVVGYGIKQLWRIHVLTRAATVLLLAAMPILATQAADHYWSLEETGWNPDIIKNKDELRKAAPKNAVCLIISANDPSNHAFSYQIDKQGHIFLENNFPIEWTEDIIKRFGVRYMYSDSKKVYEDPKMQSFIDSTLLTRGSVKVFKLKDFK